MMSKLKITYFDVNGGRAQPIRLALYLGGIEFDDDRFPYSQFSEVRKNTPLQQVPVLTINGRQVTQSNAITRYVGKLTGLYSEDDLNALLCDELMDSVEDVTSRIVTTFGLEGDELKTARTNLLEYYLVPHLSWLAKKLGENDYFIENRITIADLKVLSHISWLTSGMLEYIDKQLVESDYPSLYQHSKRLLEHSKIAEYYSKTTQ